MYCDMVSDGGGYTYYIVVKNNFVSYADGIPKFCLDFDPVDIVSPRQVRGHIVFCPGCPVL